MPAQLVSQGKKMMLHAKTSRAENCLTSPVACLTKSLLSRSPERRSWSAPFSVTLESGLSAHRLVIRVIPPAVSERFYTKISDRRAANGMKNPFSRGREEKPAKVAGLESIPPGAQVIPLEVKRLYEPNPVHIYHPTPYNAITVLRSKAQPHEFLVCGWYLDTHRQHGIVKGLIYRSVASGEDRDHVTAELKKLDKDASLRFSL